MNTNVIMLIFWPLSLSRTLVAMEMVTIFGDGQILKQTGNMPLLVVLMGPPLLMSQSLQNLLCWASYVHIQSVVSGGTSRFGKGQKIYPLL